MRILLKKYFWHIVEHYQSKKVTSRRSTNIYSTIDLPFWPGDTYACPISGTSVTSPHSARSSTLSAESRWGACRNSWWYVVLLEDLTSIFQLSRRTWDLLIYHSGESIHTDWNHYWLERWYAWYPRTFTAGARGSGTLKIYIPRILYLWGTLPTLYVKNKTFISVVELLAEFAEYIKTTKPPQSVHSLITYLSWKAHI